MSSKCKQVRNRQHTHMTEAGVLVYDDSTPFSKATRRGVEYRAGLQFARLEPVLRDMCATGQPCANLVSAPKSAVPARKSFREKLPKTRVALFKTSCASFPAADNTTRIPSRPRGVKFPRSPSSNQQQQQEHTRIILTIRY